MSEKDLSMSQLKEVHCTECGAYLGQVVPGYVKVMQCFCGAVMAVPKPSLADQEEDYPVPGQLAAA